MLLRDPRGEEQLHGQNPDFEEYNAIQSLRMQDRSPLDSLVVGLLLQCHAFIESRKCASVYSGKAVQVCFMKQHNDNIYC